ncbi:hypothetical protein QYF36_011748 [Acer negundo]|nr:hypothetical protein QYF36_011748 [Acer negundo]
MIHAIKQSKSIETWSARDLISSKEANKGWSYRVKTIFNPQGPTESWFTFVLWIISISIDPLLLYLPVINDENNSLEFNIKLVGLLGVLLLLLQSCGFAVKQAYFLTSCSFVRHYTLVLRFLLLNAMISAEVAVFTIAVNLFLVLYSWRVYGVYGLLPYKVKSSYAEEDAKTIMNKLVLNLVLDLYLEAYGTYLPLGKRLNAGKKLAEIIMVAIWMRYLASLSVPVFLDRASATSLSKPQNALSKPFASGIGQSLPASSHAAENIFVIFIIVYGVMYIKYATEASGKKRRKEKKIICKQIKKWVLFRNLSEELQNCIKKNQQYRHREIVDVNNLLKNVSKLGKFEKWSEASLFLLCDCLRPVVYTEGTRIVKEGDRCYRPVHTKGTRVLERDWDDADWRGFARTFVIQGKLWTFSKGCITADSTRKTDLLKDGDFWGEEFVNCIRNDPSSSTESITLDRTIQALTKVEVFKLRDMDLKDLYNEKAKVIQSWFRKRRNRISERNAQTSTQEQTLRTYNHGCCGCFVSEI